MTKKQSYGKELANALVENAKIDALAPLCEKHNFRGYECLQCAAEDKREYAKQQNIAFAEWIAPRYGCHGPGIIWYDLEKDEDRAYSTKEIHDLFLEHQNKQL